MKRKVSVDEIFSIRGEGSNGLLDRLLYVYVIAFIYNNAMNNAG